MSRLDVFPRVGADPDVATAPVPTSAVNTAGVSTTMAAPFFDSKTMLIIGIAIVVLLVVIAVTYLIFFKDRSPAPQKDGGGGTVAPPVVQPSTDAGAPASVPTNTPIVTPASAAPAKTAADLAEISARARAPPPSTKTDEDVAAMMEPITAEVPAEAPVDVPK